MIVDPWGLVLAQAQDMPTVIMADIDLAQIERARAQLPSLQHRRPEIYR
jgi:predicted amidohydrolase